MTEREYYHDILEQTLLSGNMLRKKLYADCPVSRITMLHGERKRPRRRLTRRTALAIAAAATLLFSGAALAAGLILSGEGSRIGFFSSTGDPELRAQQGYYERTSDAVGLPLTGDAESAALTIDNIAIDGEQVTVFYTAGMKEPLPEAVQPPAPYLSVNDGVRQLSHEQLVYAERTDAHTLTCMQSFTVPGGVPKTCTLTVGFDSLFGKSGDWRHTFWRSMTRTFIMRSLCAASRWTKPEERSSLRRRRPATRCTGTKHTVHGATRCAPPRPHISRLIRIGPRSTGRTADRSTRIFRSIRAR